MKIETKITLKFKDITVELTPQELQELAGELNKLTGNIPTISWPGTGITYPTIYGSGGSFTSPPSIPYESIKV